MIWILSCKVEDLPEPGTPMPQPEDTQVGDFYVRLGMTIAAWQFVEASLINVYANAIGARNHPALAASFHTPASFRARLDMTNEAVIRSNFPKYLIEKWADLYVSIVRKSKRRNNLTHALVFFDPKIGKKENQLFLAPNVEDPTRHKAFSQSTVLTGSHLVELMHSFEQIHSQIGNFISETIPYSARGI